MDAIMSQRGGSEGEHEGSRRMKTELLIQMDGLLKSSAEQIFLLCASNLPWDLDGALLRRLEKRILVDLPDKNSRKSILEHFLSNTPDVMFDDIAEKTKGFSGADMQLLAKEASMRPLRKLIAHIEKIETGLGGGEQEVKLRKVTNEDVLCALKVTKPSSAQPVKYDQWQEQFGSS
eukprot:GHVL01036911.1.p1 GENE.GHVL01036911.1~~GHVL01036911.1.p1  ORF type:complete len:176 (+),score=36.54 GHVL01036911.1:983-1510(+)